MKVIMIANQKGGAGKTTTTLELSYLFGLKNKVLAIDLDPSVNMTTYVGASAKKTVKDVLDLNIIIDDAIEHVMTFDFLAGDKRLSGAPKEYGDPDDIFRLDDILKQVAELDSYDYVFIDSAPGRSPLLYMEYVCADYIIAPSECDDGGIDGLYEMNEDLKRFRKRNQTKAVILGTLLTKYRNTNLHKIAYNDLLAMKETIGAEPFNVVIRESIRASESKSYRLSVNEYETNNAVAIDYRKLQQEVEKRIKKYE